MKVAGPDNLQTRPTSHVMGRSLQGHCVLGSACAGSEHFLLELKLGATFSFLMRLSVPASSIRGGRDDPALKGRPAAGQTRPTMAQATSRGCRCRAQRHRNFFFTCASSYGCVMRLCCCFPRSLPSHGHKGNLRRLNPVAYHRSLKRSPRNVARTSALSTILSGGPAIRILPALMI